MKIKYIIQDLMFLRTFNSPFKPLKLRWYFGKIAVAVPYFYPRKWVKYTLKDCIEEATKAINNERLIKKSFEEWVENYKNYSKAVSKKIGFDFVSLGWKTKWSDTDIRFEWSPRWSFVFFGYQAALIFVAPHESHYWECFLYYYFHTDKNQSKDERIKECIRKNPCLWTTHTNEGKETIDYYPLILKKKYK